MKELFWKKKETEPEVRETLNSEEVYMHALLGQIRCKKAHRMISEEIRGHIEEQMETNLADGMEPEEALQEAVKDMGDPVETGVALDAVHRPRPAWSMIILVGVISVISIFIHIVLGMGKAASGNFYGWYGQSYIIRATLHTVAGFAVMLGIYLLDYTFIGRYARIIGGGLIVLMLSVFLTIPVNGGQYRIWGVENMAGPYVGLLFVPVYGAILYYYRGSGYQGLLKALLWMILPAWIVMRMPNFSIAVQIFYCMAVMLTAAILKNWFRIRGKTVLIGMWAVIVVLPAVMLAASLRTGLFLAEYQRMRLQAYIGGDTSEYNYIAGTLKRLVENSYLLGRSEGGQEVLAGNVLPGFDCDYVLTWIGSYYGTLAAGIVCVLLFFLIWKVLRISFGQQNQLGMMIGFGCGMVLLSSVGINVMENLCLLPTSATFLPFFSYGGSGTFVCYILMGMVLSIYRFKDVLPADAAKGKEKSPVR